MPLVPTTQTIRVTDAERYIAENRFEARAVEHGFMAQESDAERADRLQGEIDRLHAEIAEAEPEFKRLEAIIAWYWRTAGPYPSEIDEIGE